jgi:hypothetical protein
MRASNCAIIIATKSVSNSKRISYQELVIGLDKLFFGGQISNQEQAEERADTIDAYLEACGWTWDLILQEMCREEAGAIQSKLDN